MSTRKFDDFLGPASQRYFGEGYRRTTYSVGQFDRVLEGEVEGVATSARVDYPPDWSVKDGVVRQPHLSTVDALVLAATAARHALKALGGLDDHQVRWAWFSDLTIRAGARPTIDLDRVPVRCEIVERRQDAKSCSSALRFKIGTFSVAAVVRHPFASAESVEATPSGSEPYTTLFRETSHQSWITQIDADLATIECVHQVVAERAHGPIEGIEAAYGPQPTLIDSLVLAGQMQQVLIATADGVARASSGNLWLRRISFVARTPWRSPRSRSRLAIIGRQEISRGGTTLHGVDVRCDDLGGVDILAKIAYEERTE